MSCSTVRNINLETDQYVHIDLYLKKGKSRMLHKPLTAQDLVSLEPCIPPKRERGFGLTLTPLSSWSVEGGWGSGYETVIVDIDCVVTYCDSVSLIPRTVC